MNEEIRSVDQLTAADVERFPIWEFTNREDNKHGELAISPVKKIPVSTLTGRLIATKVTLANGSQHLALLSNIDVKNPRATEQFLTLQMWDHTKWIALARYFDPMRARMGPEALAKRLGLRVEDLFPIHYDISSLCVGDSAALIGLIDREPKGRLTGAQLMELTLRKR